MKKPTNFIFKILIVGEKDVGKTSLIYRYIENQFLLKTKQTIGVEISLKYIDLDNEKYTLQIWDLGGEKYFFKFFYQTFSTGADGGIVIFDLTRKDTLKNIPEWVKMCRSWNKEIPIILVGNKYDLSKRLEISDEIGNELKDILKCKKYIKTSAKTGLNVERIFKLITILITNLKKEKYKNV